MRVRFAGKTDVGLQRDHNEDALLVMPAHGVMIVADGLGGHRSGHIASELAVSTLSDFFSVTVRSDATWPFPFNDQLTDEENYLFTGIRLANRRIFDRSLKAMSDFGMGTTCVGAMFSKDAKRVSIANVGDSRCYRIRGNDVKQLTRDHSLVSDAVESAPWMSEEEIARLPPNVITRALGIREDVVVDLHNEATHGGDVYLCCSDGLSGLVGPGEMRDLIAKELVPVVGSTADGIPGGVAPVERPGAVAKAPADAGLRDAFAKEDTARQTDPVGAAPSSGEAREKAVVAALERACHALVERANYYGGPDNITVVLAYVEPPPEPEPAADDEEDEAMANTERGSERPKPL